MGLALFFVKPLSTTGRMRRRRPNSNCCSAPGERDLPKFALHHSPKPPKRVVFYHLLLLGAVLCFWCGFFFPWLCGFCGGRGGEKASRAGQGPACPSPPPFPLGRPMLRKTKCNTKTPRLFLTGRFFFSFVWFLSSLPFLRYGAGGCPTQQRTRQKEHVCLSATRFVFHVPCPPSPSPPPFLLNYNS